MLEKKKAQLRDLKRREVSYKWDIEEIKHADMDPERKAMYLNDAMCEHYMLENQIIDLESEIRMYPFKVTLIGFVIFVLGMTICMML